MKSIVLKDVSRAIWEALVIVYFYQNAGMHFIVHCIPCVSLCLGEFIKDSKVIGNKDCLFYKEHLFYGI